MPKVTLNDVTSGYSAATVVNANNDRIEAAIENTLSRDGSTPNGMNARLDMNSNRIVNLASPAASNDAARWVDVTSAVDFTGVVAPSQSGNADRALFTDGSTASWRKTPYIVRTTAEISASVTPSDYSYEPGDVRRYGAVGDGSTDNTTAIQNALSANAGAFPVVFEAGASYFRLIGRVTAPANTEIVLKDGAELRWTATTSTGTAFLGTATRPGIEVTGDNFRLTGRGTLRGPTSAAYVLNEVAVFAKGTSTSSRKSGFYVDGEIEFLNWGAYGVLLQFVDRARVFRTRTHDIGYCGIQFVSCTNVRACFNEVYNITPGDASNAYGISGSHDSTGYSTDPNIATPRLVANPFCIDCDISFNTIYDIPVWRGVDFHGGYECRANHNNIYNTKWPIGVGAGSGAAANYAGENMQACYNYITAKRRDGSASTVADFESIAIVLNGGSVVQNKNVQCVGNIIDGYGLSTAAGAHCIEATYVRNATIRDNKFLNWQRDAIYSVNGDGVIAGNLFDAVANAANSRCIWIDGGTYAWNVTGNRHEPHGGTVAAEGLRITTGSPRTAVNDNNFAQATTPYVNADGTLTSVHQTFAAEVGQRRTVAYSASITIDAREGNTFEVTATNGTAFTVNAPTNPADGQVMLLTIKNTSGGALGAITWNAVFKMAAWTSPATANNRSITFVYDGTNWIERHRTASDIPN